jgi:hypothetical protein
MYVVLRRTSFGAFDSNNAVPYFIETKKTKTKQNKTKQKNSSTIVRYMRQSEQFALTST